MSEPHGIHKVAKDVDVAANGSLAQHLQRISDAEERLKTEFANIEGILQEVRSVVSVCSAQGSTCESADDKAPPDAKRIVTSGDGVLAAGAKLPSAPVTDSPAEFEPDDSAAKHAITLSLSAVREEVAGSLGLTPDDVSCAYNVFIECDKDNSLKLDTTEAHYGLERLTGQCIDKDHFQRILSVFDRDIDAALSFEEFLFLYCHTPGKKLNHLAKFSTHVRFYGNRLSSNFRAQIGGVKTSHVRDYVQEELIQMASCLKLPFVILMFAFFFFSCELHGMKDIIASGSEHAVKFHIEENANFAFSTAIPFDHGRIGHKNIYDVNTPPDFWSWFGVGLVPLLFPAPSLSETRLNVLDRCLQPADALLAAGFSSNDTDFPTNTSLANDLGNLCQQQTIVPPFENLGRNSPFLSTQSILAGVRLQQKVYPVSRCKLPELLSHAFDGSCTGTGKAWFRPNLLNVMGMDKSRVDQSVASTEFFLSKTPQQEVLQRLMALENNAWISQRSQKVEILFTTYNPDTTRLTALYIYFAFNRAGHIHKFVKPVTIDLSVYDSPWMYIVDALFCLSIVKVAIDEALMLLRRCTSKGLRSWNYRQFGFSRIVDWVVVVLGVYTCVCWIQLVVLRVQLKELVESGDMTIPGTWAKAADRINFFELVDSCCQSTLNQLFLVGIYSLFLGLRFFDAFSGQPRLALVTNTLSSASTEVIHFGVVIGSMIVVFSMSAQLLFGYVIEDFGSFDRALWTLFKGMVDGLDTSELQKVDRPLAAYWGFVFTVLLQMLMLNMLLAIVFDVYAKVKSEVPPSAETFWSQSYEIFRRWRDLRLGRRVSLHIVRAFLDSETCKQEYVTVPVLLQSIPGLGESQALRILRHADDRAAELESSSAGDEMTQHVHCIDLRIQQLQQMLTAFAEVLEPCQGITEDTSQGASRIAEL